MKRTKILLSTFISTVVMAMPAVAADYDVVINGGRVIDPETNYDAVANVGVKDGKIAVITSKQIKGKETVDAKGMVVAPGFIDTHFHFQMPVGYSLGRHDAGRALPGIQKLYF